MKTARRFVAVLAAVSAMGCITSKNVSLVENQDPASRPQEIEVTSRGGVYTVHWPVVEGDSLRGWQDRKRTRTSSFALSEIQRARVRELSGERTAVAFGIGIVATIAAVFFLGDPITIGY
jgi:hypothetical protein